MANDTDVLHQVLTKDETRILERWLDQQTGTRGGFGSARVGRTELAEQCQRFLSVFQQATASGETDVQSPTWEPVRRLLDEIALARTQQGFSPAETAMFVFSLKPALFEALGDRLAAEPRQALEITRTLNLLVDRLGLYTTEVFQRGREQVIIRQQQEMLELSTPVVMLWDGVLALPVIGTLDSSRTQVVMENLLQRIVDTGAAIAIIDITGVPTVDTLTAQHLLKTVAAARLMGADCIISGIRPQIAQTIVHLGVDLGSVVTKATLADAFALALRRLGLAVGTQGSGAGSPRGKKRPDRPDGGETRAITGDERHES